MPGRLPGRVVCDRGHSRATSTRRRPSRCTRPPARRCWPRSTRGTPTRGACTARPATPGCCSTTPARWSPSASACAATRSSSPSSGPTPCTAGCSGCCGPRRDAVVALRRRALRGAARAWPGAGRRAARRSPVDRPRPGRPRRGRAAPPSVVAAPVAPTTRSARSSRSPRRRRAATYRSSSTPAPRWAGSRCPSGWARRRRLGAQVGRPGRRRRAAGPQGRALAQPVPRRRPGRRAGRAASRTSRPRWPPRPRCRPSSPSATRSTPASTRWSTGSAPAVAAIPDVEVVGDPVDRLPHLVTFSCLYVDGEALVDRARPARLRRRQRLGLHRLDPRAEPRARGDGRAHPRQRPGLADPRHHRGRRRRLPRRAARGRRARSGRRSACDARRTSSSTAAGMLCPLPVIELAKRIADVEVGGLVAVVDRRRGRAARRPGLVPDARPGVRRRGRRRRRRAALPGPPAQLSAGSATSRCGRTAAAASAP